MKELEICDTCKNEKAGLECLKCGKCGRKFKGGKLEEENENVPRV